jgi:hypothetical protein
MSIGSDFSNSTKCNFITNEKSSYTSSQEGNSAWITCPKNTYGTYLYITTVNYE